MRVYVTIFKKLHVYCQNNAKEVVMINLLYALSITSFTGTITTGGPIATCKSLLEDTWF